VCRRGGQNFGGSHVRQIRSIKAPSYTAIRRAIALGSSHCHREPARSAGVATQANRTAERRSRAK